MHDDGAIIYRRARRSVRAELKFDSSHQRAARHNGGREDKKISISLIKSGVNNFDQLPRGALLRRGFVFICFSSTLNPEPKRKRRKFWRSKPDF